MIVDQLFEDDDKKKKLNEVDPQNFDSDEDYYDAVEADDLDLDKFGNGWDIPDEIAVLRNQLRHTTSQYARDQIENKIKRYEDIYYGEDDLEEDAPVADLTTGTTNQTYTPPSRGFGVMIKLNMPDPRLREAAKEVWEALETILPRDYPRVPFQQQSGNEPQVRVIEDLRNDGFSIVKQQIGSQDIAQTIANKFEGRSIPAEVIDSGIFEEYDPAQSSKFISAATKAAKIMFDFERGYNQAFRAELENQYGFDPDSPGYEVSPHKATELIKWLNSKGCELSFNKKEPIEFALTMPGQNQPYEFNILDMIQGGELEEGNKFFQQHGIGVQNGKFPEPRKPHFPGDQGSKSETLGKDGLIYHWQDPRAKQGMSESKHNKQRKLNEAMLMEDPIYRKFKTVGRYIAEYKMTEKQILDVFAQAEQGMTNAGTGANRTMLGRGKDTATKFAGDVSSAVKGVLNSIQNSVPVAAVDVAYDQATDALANVAGGQSGPVMNAIKKYRMLAKEYPKTAGFAKAALVAIAGLATGGAGLPAIAGLTYALDSAIKGDKLSSVLGKGAGAAALSAAGQAIAGGDAVPDASSPDGYGIPGQFDGGQYTIQQGDQIGYIAQANGVSTMDIEGLNPQIDFSKPLQPGMNINLPPQGDGVGSVWQGYTGGNYGDTVAGAGQAAPATSAINPADVKPFGAGSPDTSLLSNPGAGGEGVLSNVGTDQIMQSPAYKQAFADNMAKFGNGPFAAQNAHKAALAAAKGAMVRESINALNVKVRKLSADKLIDQKSTVMNWALSESIGVKSKSVNLTTVGTYTVFENVDRFRKAILEARLPSTGVGPGRGQLPDLYRPDMPDAPTQPADPAKKSWFGKGLDYLDKGAKKVGGALSNFGHQFTTGVTKEKLKMNWHQAGKPSDSDALAAWLVKQGVPQEVVTSVYSGMGIPYTAPAAAEPASTATPATGGAQKQMAFYGTNPATKKPWTYDELQAKATAGKTPAAPAPTDDATADTPAASTTTATLPAGGGAGVTAAAGPAGFNANNVMSLPGMEKYAKKPAAPAKTPNFAGPGGYAQVNQPTTVSYSTGKKPAAAPATAAPAGTRVVSGGPTPDEQARLAQRIAQATAKPVAEMLSMVETKEDVTKIKKFVDQTFVKYGAVSESAFAVRNKLIEHITQVGAQRRREFARKS